MDAFAIAGPRCIKPRRFDADLVVIGAGTGGLVSAYVAATLKATVVLVEKPPAIAVADRCFGCTAGLGFSCGGALASAG